MASDIWARYSLKIDLAANVLKTMNWEANEESPS